MRSPRIPAFLVLFTLLSAGEAAAQEPDTAPADAGIPAEADAGSAPADAGVSSGPDAGSDAGEQAPETRTPSSSTGEESPKTPTEDKTATAATGEDETVYDIEEAQVTGYRIQRTDRVTGFAETIPVLEERKRVTDLSEMLSRSVGVQVRSLGGLGAYGAASIRGSTPNQVPVFLDGIQLNVGGVSVVDLGDLSLDVLDSVEVYRGNAPLALGTSGIGGAIVLRTRRFDQPVTELSGSYGSWDTWRLYGLYGAQVFDVDTLAIASLQHSDGDFRYYNRNGTFRNKDDDAFVNRSNNMHTAGSAMLKLDRRFDDWTVRLMDDFYYKDQGLAGIDHMIGKSDAELETLRNAVNLRFERPLGNATELDLDLSYLYMRVKFDDMGGNIGTGHQDHVYDTNAATAAALLAHEFSAEHITTFRVATRYEHYAEDRLNATDEADQQKPSHRIRTELGAEHDWAPFQPLHIVPTLRSEIHYAYFGGGPTPGLLTYKETTEKTGFFFSPSLGVRYQVVDGLTLRANGGRYTRTPDLAELFGDRGAVIGNPDLRPEIGYNVDVGLTYVLVGNNLLDLLRCDAAWFASWVKDLISLEQNSQSTSRPINLNAARIQGVELALRVSLIDLVTLSGNYTYFDGVDDSDMERYRGKRLPGRPMHEIYGRFDLGRTGKLWGAGGWFDVDYAGRSYVGQYNDEDYVTMHLFVGTGARFELPPAGLTFTFEVKNLLDALVFKNEEGVWLPMSDYNRYPLPGRTYLGTLHWQWL